MAQIVITFPDAQQNRVVNAICSLYNYRTTIGGEANPETKAQFAKRMVLLNFKNLVAQGEGKVAIETATAEIEPT
jgi:hypothetical protein